MEEILVIVFQFLIEFTINALSHLPVDWPSKKRRTPERESMWALCLLSLAGGALLGWLSLLVFDYALLQPGWLRIVNLFASPVASACLAQFIAARRAATNPMLIPRNHFWYGFWFSVGVAVVRFSYASR